MRKLLIILLSALSLTSFAQDKKTVAVLEPICRDKSVKPFYQLLIRGEMESAVTATDEYVSFDRTAFDKISEEQKFQRSGAVNDNQIKRLGEIAGVDYILVTEVMADEGYITCIAKILNVETGHSTKSYNELMELNAPSVKNGCRSLTAQLFGLIDMNTGLRKGELLLEEGRYVGEIKNGKPDGKGKIQYKNTDDKERLYYEGEWKDGEPNGHGIAEWKDGTKYDGEWVNSMKEGEGILYIEFGRYEGHFENNQVNGYGTCYFNNGWKYVGNWKNGEKHGQGILYIIDGSRIDRLEGNFENNDITYGTYYYASGDKYVGNWKDGVKSGRGIFYFADGNRYEGNFENDWINGYGACYYTDGDKYVGNWKDGERHGFGTYYSSNGSWAEGAWENDCMNGPATFYGADGSKLSGSYVNGKQDGEWISIEVNGKKQKATYSNGKLIRDWH